MVRPGAAPRPPLARILPGVNRRGFLAHHPGRIKKVPYDLIVIGSGPGGYSAAIRAGQYGLKTALVEKTAPTGRHLPAGGMHSHQEPAADRRRLGALRALRQRRHPLRESAPRLPQGEGPQGRHRHQAFQGRRACCSSAPRWSASAGYATLKGGGKVEVQSEAGTQTLEAQQHHYRHRLGGAHASRPAARPRVHPHQHRDSEPDRRARRAWPLSARARWGWSSRPSSTASARTSRSSRCCRASCRWKTRTFRRNSSATSASRRFASKPARAPRTFGRPARASNSRSPPATASRKTLEAEKLLVAVGRKPNTDKIGIENTKVELDRGFIKVNEYQQTAEPGVYAIGDVVAGTPQLAHVATREGMIAVAHMAGQAGRAHQPQPHPRLHLYRAGHRQRGADRGAGARAGPQGEDRHASRSPATAAPPSWAITTASSRW